MVEANYYEYPKVLKSLGEAAKNLDDVPIEPLCVALYEWTILFKHLGKSLSMAFADITEKVEIMRNHVKSYGSQIAGIQSLIQLEAQLDLQKLNSENNKDFTKNKDYFKYASGAQFNLISYNKYLLFRNSYSSSSNVVHGFSNLHDGGTDQGPKT